MGSLTDLLGRTPRVAIIEAFSEHPELDFSAPEIARQTGIAKRSVYLHVTKLLEEGLIRKGGKVGKCQFYRVNENDRRGELLEVLEAAFTLGKVEREVKRDRGIAPERPLVPQVELEVASELGFTGLTSPPPEAEKLRWTESLAAYWPAENAFFVTATTPGPGFREVEPVGQDKLRSVISNVTTASTVTETSGQGVRATSPSEAEQRSQRLFRRAR